MNLFWTVIAIFGLLYSYACHCRTRAYCRVCDFILDCDSWPVSTLTIHRETGVSVGWVFVVLDELERKELVYGFSVPAGHPNGRAMRLIYLGKQKEVAP